MINSYRIFYAIKHEMYEIYDNLNNSAKSNPDFIIELKSKGTTISRFSERATEDEHFEIKYYDENGIGKNFSSNLWSILSIQDPMRYGKVLDVKISDPVGKIRIFDVWNSNCHYENTFHNFIESLIRLYNFFYSLCEYKSWDEFEKNYFEHRTKKLHKNIEVMNLTPGKLNKYYRK